MYKTEFCPCCGSSQTKGWPAVVAPFLAHYACLEKPGRCSLRECLSCSFRYFDARLTEDEVSRLYSSYRKDDYFEARHGHEFWYSRRVNDGIGTDPREIESRRGNLQKLIESDAPGVQISSVLDYGGDRGQFIPDNFGQQRYVFEISDAVPVEGVTRLGSIDGRKFDFIMLGHVLEHCSDPRDILETLKQYGHAETLYYFEVPYERVNMALAANGKLQEKYLDVLIGIRPALTAMDLFSTVTRVKFNAVVPLGFPKCSEHLNFFDESSARALLDRSGYKMTSCKISDVYGTSQISQVLQLLAHRA